MNITHDQLLDIKDQLIRIKELKSREAFSSWVLGGCCAARGDSRFEGTTDNKYVKAVTGEQQARLEADQALSMLLEMLGQIEKPSTEAEG